jgi:SUMO ligase MMS21 Smc5/6 complex component
MTTDNNNNLWDDILFAIAISISALLLVAFSGCKTIETSKTDLSTIDKKDSVRTEIRYVTDTIYQTIYITQKDSTANEKESTTEIIFSDGGTWNATTGEATNVQSVKTSESEKNLRLQVSNLESQLTDLHKELQSKNDSITKLNQKNNIVEKHKEKPKNNWYLWLVIGFGLGVGVVIALKKIPATSWFMKWL